MGAAARRREVERIVYLDPDSIADPTNDSRTEDEPGSEAEAPTDEPSFAQLVRSIRRRGLLQPIGVRQLPSGDYELLFGSRRRRAFKLAKPGEKIPCLVKADCGDFDALLDSFGENFHRRKIKPHMIAETLCRLRELEPNYALSAIAQELGVTEQYCSDLIRLKVRLRPDLWELYKRWGESLRVGFREAVEVSRLPHDEQQSRWNALVDAKGKVGGGKVRGKQRRPGERRIARYLDAALAGDLGGRGREFRRGVIFALRVVLGERKWDFGDGRRSQRRVRKSA